MTFSYSSPLDYDQPVADAGENVVVVLPGSTAVLDGSESYDPENAPLFYQWTQVYGPSQIIFLMIRWLNRKYLNCLKDSI